ncbi:MAG: glycosyl hydrolase 115 family protein, partial [Clostridia bacterium]|nr:glycosyl hydrolase 115 family protein [Clostridia bacterium]
IVLSPDAPEAVVLATEDLRRDLLAVSGRAEGFEIVTDTQEPAIVIKTDRACAASFPEGYTVTVSERGIEIVGTDVLGTVFGIYALSTKYLGVDPLYFFTDITPRVRKSLALPFGEVVATRKRCRFRGWFINDEDFLSGYAPSGAKRAITTNRPFFQEVISTEIMDRIYEALLRLELNLIIPASYLDILNPAEEAIVAAAVKRGLYVSMHHQETVGVAYFSAQNYMKAHHPGKEVSFVQNPREMEEIWRSYAKVWAKYDGHVIWQLGLRGKGDVAVWRTDGSVGATPEARGKLLSDVMALQHRVIAEAVGHTDFLSTTTLWLEGAELYEQGHLKLPCGTIAVFSDVGDTQMLGGDFYRARNREGIRYGVYYHAGFFAEGPHYTDGVDPRKMAYCYRELAESDAICLSVLNVGNLRELCASVRLNAAILGGDPTAFSLDRYYDTVYPTLWGEAAPQVAALERAYFDAIGDLGVRMGNEILSYRDFYAYDPGDLPFPYYPLTDGTLMRAPSWLIGAWWRRQMAVYTENAENFHHFRRVVEASLPKYEALLPRLLELEASIPENARYHFRFAKIYQCELMLLLTRRALYVSEMCLGNDVERHRDLAIGSLIDILKKRKEFEKGKWKDWYKLDVRLSVTDRIRELCEFDPIAKV